MREGEIISRDNTDKVLSWIDRDSDNLQRTACPARSYGITALSQAESCAAPLYHRPMGRPYRPVCSFLVTPSPNTVSQSFFIEMGTQPFSAQKS